MIYSPFKMPLRQTIASIGLLALFTLLACAGFALVVYGVGLLSRPAAFIVAGIIIGCCGFLCALGCTGRDQEEDF